MSRRVQRMSRIKKQMSRRPKRMSRAKKLMLRAQKKLPRSKNITSRDALFILRSIMLQPTNPIIGTNHPKQTSDSLNFQSFVGLCLCMIFSLSSLEGGEGRGEEAR